MEQQEQPEQQPTLDVVYEDEHLLAAHKPAGMLVHRGWGDSATVLVDLVREYQGGGKVHTIHRLDRPTSGVVLFARSPECARALGAMFEAREVLKRYLALVRGTAPERGFLDHPVPREPRGKERVEAQSSLRRVAFLPDTLPRECSLVEIAPHSGRVHQLRRHLRHLNHPILGDSTYGRGHLNRAFSQDYGLERMALHAYRVSMVHPMTGEALEIVAPLAPDLQRAFGAMGMPEQVWQALQADASQAWMQELPALK